MLPPLGITRAHNPQQQLGALRSALLERFPGVATNLEGDITFTGKRLRFRNGRVLVDQEQYILDNNPSS